MTNRLRKIHVERAWEVCFKVKEGKNPPPLSQKDIKLLDKWLEDLKANGEWVNVGPSFLYDYCLFQLIRKQNLALTATHGKLNFSMLFGPKALATYLEKYKSMSVEWLSSINKLKESFTRKIFFEKVEPLVLKVVPVSSYETRLHKLAQQKARPFLVCLRYELTMYHPGDEICQQCLDKKSCIDYLKNQFPLLYNLRFS